MCEPEFVRLGQHEGQLHLAPSDIQRVTESERQQWSGPLSYCSFSNIYKHGCQSPDIRPQ